VSDSLAAQEYTEVTLVVHSNLVDAVSNYITENITSGLQLEDSGEDELVSIKFFVATDSKDFRKSLEEYLSQITTEFESKPELRERKVKSTDWEESYRQSIEPVYVGDDIVVRPPWKEAVQSVKYDIVIEPKMAFGTGHHETTRACLKLIQKYFEKGQRILDFGCGSGVLAILAGKIGAEYIKAVDYDPIAVENTLENFTMNTVECEFDIVLGSFETIESGKAYDMVCSNLEMKYLSENLGKLADVTVPNGVLLLSGLLSSDRFEIEKVIGKANLEVMEFIHDGEWLTYGLRR
jgi:ribosomal protein L11 methyltransferase